LVRALTILPNGDLVSTSSGFESNSCQIKIWNPNNGTLKHTSSGNTYCLWALATSPNGNIVSGSDKTIKIWSLNDVTNNTKLNAYILNYKLQWPQRICHIFIRTYVYSV
jgi:WD40 repeat protein